MFGMGMGEIVLIAVVALLVLGPERLPGAAKAIGKGIRDLRQQTKSLQSTIELDTDIGDAVREIRGALRGDPETLYKKATGDDWHGDEQKMGEPTNSESGESVVASETPDVEGESVASGDASSNKEKIAEPETGTDRTLKALNLFDEKYADTDDGWSEPVVNPHEASDDTDGDPDMPKIQPAGGTMARSEVVDEFSKDTGDHSSDV